MDSRIRVLLADQDRVFRHGFKEQLVSLGYLVVAEAEDGLKALNLAFKAEPDLLFLDDQLKGRDAFRVARAAGEHNLAPSVLLTADCSQVTLEESRKGYVYGILVKSMLHPALIMPAVELAIANFGHWVELKNHQQRVERDLKNRKQIERAKGLLMAREQWTEEQAYDFLRRSSMERCLAIEDLARELLHEYGKERS